MKSLIAQCRAEFTRTLRNRRFVFTSILMPLLFYFIFARATGGAADAEMIRRIILISMASFSLIGTAINTFGLRLANERSRGWTRLLKVTPMPSAVYLGAKLLVQTALNVFSLLILFVAAGINGVSMPAGIWIGSGLWLLVGSIPFLALGALLGMALPVESAQPVGNLIYLVLSLLGGLWMPLQMLPDIIQKIGKWTPTYRFASMAWNIVQGKVIDWNDLAILVGYTILFMVLSIRLERRQQLRAAI